MFFQIALLLGYLYSHAATKWLEPKQQAMLHTILLVASVFLLPIMPGQQWKPLDEKEPLLRIFLLLCGTVGLPYLMLSTTGSVVAGLVLTSQWRCDAVSIVRAVKLRIVSGSAQFSLCL